MKIKYFIPLICFLAPTWIITYLRWPVIFKQYSDIGKESLIGMVIMWFFMALNYYLGIRSVLRDR
jgi:hypothetical protein